MSDPAKELEHAKATYAWNLEERKIQAAANLETQKTRATEQIEMHSAAMAFANAALRGLFLLNGGGVLAILSFVGNLYAKNDSDARSVAHSSSLSINYFVAGVSAAVLATGLAYISQIIFVETYGRRGGWWVANFLRILTCILAVGSLALFWLGAGGAIGAMATENR